MGFLLVARAFLGNVLKFIMTYWRQILCIILVLIVLRITYNAGFNSADSDWTAFHNKNVKDLNAKITELEGRAKAGDAKLKTDNAALKKKLEEIVTSTPTIVLHDSTGKPVKCEGKDVKVYLGPAFQQAWNDINKESNKP